jgi:hypothetical protein
MKKLFIVLILSVILTPVFCQEENSGAAVVEGTFTTGSLIDNQTIMTPPKGGLELQIQHRFSLIESIDDLFGIYGSANTRIGLTYGISDRWSVGLGTTKDYKLQDLNWKYVILRQTSDNSMPVSLAYYGNIVAELTEESNFGPTETFKQIHRLSYFTQLIVARKFSEKLSIQVAPSFVYYNSVPRYTDTTGYQNMNFAVSVGGRYNVFGNHSVILEYDQLLTKQDLDVQPKPNLSLGWEIGTPTHAFQVFVANYNLIINQKNLVFNSNDFAKGDFLFGFNITVRF